MLTAREHIEVIRNAYRDLAKDVADDLEKNRNHWTNDYLRGSEQARLSTYQSVVEAAEIALADLDKQEAAAV